MSSQILSAVYCEIKKLEFLFLSTTHEIATHGYELTSAGYEIIIKYNVLHILWLDSFSFKWVLD